MSHRTTSGNDWIWVATRWSIYARDGFACIACGSLELSLDHVVPGNWNEPENLVTLCPDCNTDKGARTFKAWRPELVDRVFFAISSPIDRKLGRELAREFRPSRLAAHEYRSTRAERARRAARAAAAIETFFDGFGDAESA